ncbi:MAG: hypothetical protein COY56_06105 [Flavobacteriaceae bacterium CG_4_10_14_0_8_um_filter_34_31]|nr:hypothetical protein [Flavobacteriia bacterium]PIZ07990.1 MAG: hypothetical protein COY56_06105 [Flavobacteriaceae bacterium CG_4_10_14_0_8_um_filter_34_31]
MENFQKRQDSLRNELLKIKNDKLLLNTVFEEHYIRGLVTNEMNFLKFRLPFNLHAPDCGAPDCYTTELTFEISNNLPIKLPSRITINGVEDGCVESKSWSGDFELLELNEQLVNYYSAELQSNLYFTKNGRLIYFPHEKGKSISLIELDKMYDRWEFDDAEITPYLSTIMTTSEYELFLD